jgi:hypothetical protein
MTHFFNRLAFPDYSEITGIWTNPEWADPTDDDIAIGHLIRLPYDQDPSLESDFLCSHMPFHVGGFSGLHPDGSPWLFIVQVAPAGASLSVGEGDPFWAMQDGLLRALRFNKGATAVDELSWDRALLEYAYASEGVKAEQISDWSVDALIRGLLTECCYVELSEVVAGRSDGCSFPGGEHACTGDVFTDVFQRWASGELPVPGLLPDEPPARRPGTYFDDDAAVDREFLEAFSDKAIRLIAEELGIRTKKQKSKKWRSRERLIASILKALEPDVGAY